MTTKPPRLPVVLILCHCGVLGPGFGTPDTSGGRGMRHALVGRLTWRSASGLPDGPTSSRYHPVPLASLAPDVDDDWASAPLSASLWFHVQLGDDLRVDRPLRIEESLEIEGIP